MKYWLFIFSALPLSAQTSIAVGQMSCPASQNPQVVVAVPLVTIANIPIVRLVCASLDPATLVLDVAGKPPVLRAIVPSGSSTNFVVNETPSGSVDGANITYTLASSPVAGSVQLYRNGLRQKPGLDYNLSGTSINFLAGSTPQPGDTLLADYRR